MGESQQRDPGPMARFEAMLRDGEWPDEVARRVAEGEDLREIARSCGVPKGRFIEWFTQEHAGKYDAARKALGLSLVHAVQRMVDEATPETAALVKLRTDRYLRVAEMLAPERYARRVEHSHRHVVDIGERLRRARERVLEQVKEGPPALPAPVVEQDTAGGFPSAGGGVTSRAEMPGVAPAVEDTTTESPRPPRSTVEPLI